MSTCSKVDKEYLRQIYFTNYSSKIEIERMMKSAQSRKETIQIKDNNHQVDLTRTGNYHNELARGILAKVLGLRGKTGNILDGRPRDDEDFFDLGGDSLLAVLAIEYLRQIGLHIDVQVFAESGKISNILSGIQLTEPLEKTISNTNDITAHFNDNISIYSANKKLNSFSKSSHQDCSGLTNEQMKEAHNIFDETAYDIRIVEWDGAYGDMENDIHSVGGKQRMHHIISETVNSQGITTDQIIQLVVRMFMEKDHVTHVLKMDEYDLKCAVEIFLNSYRTSGGIVLLAKCKLSNCTYIRNQSHATEDKLIGVLISLPLKSTPILNKTKKLRLIQRYFDSCVEKATIEIKEIDHALNVLMIGITSKSPYDEAQFVKENIKLPNWRNMILSTLTKLESTLIQSAYNKGYREIHTLNTSDVTTEVGLSLGYQMVQTISLKAFAAKENLPLPNSLERTTCTYMVKHL